MSTIITMLADLETRFNAIDELSGVQVSVGDPFPERLQKDLIVIGGGDANENFAGIGQDARDEIYEINTPISILRPARLAHLVVLQRAFEIAQLIEDSIIAWRTEDSVFNGIKGWVGINSKTWGPGPPTDDGKEREAVVILKIGVNARI